MSKQFSGGLFAAKKPKALVPSEANVSKSLEGFLNARKIKNYRLNSGKIKQKGANGRDYWIHLLPTGTPDRVFFVSGLAYFVEVKKRGETPSPAQIVEHRDLTERGGCVVLVSDSIENFISQFNALFPDRAQKVFVR